MLIDLNADLGEGFGIWPLGDDTALLEVVTSANVACGFHAGDPVTMLRVCREAARRGVAVGAQVGYRDLAGFGRRRIDVDPDELHAEVLYQLGALAGIAQACGVEVGYVKPHGALYTTAADDPAQAGALARAVAEWGRARVPLLGLPGSQHEHAAAQAAIGFVAEGFADRAYTDDGRLVDRRLPGAVLTDTEAVVAQALRLARSGTVASLCLHGDTPGAVAHARAVRAALVRDGVTVRSFLPGR